jgi:hypothetical protein
MEHRLLTRVIAGPAGRCVFSDPTPAAPPGPADFRRAAVFFVLPTAAPPNRLFNQPEYEGRKLQYLASRGYEIGNHTLWHANLGKYGATVGTQIA